MRQGHKGLRQIEGRFAAYRDLRPFGGGNGVAAAFDYRWRRRAVMASRGMYATADLRPLLAERGFQLSRARSTGWSPSGRNG
ncbi:hypothetical protein [Nonomuraea sp. 3N208]|uniref:hypothetical protein n=1 Tax=Nonomuraea sp. 3N208 TaxID=3457421 RepID=UPI003FD5DD26